MEHPATACLAEVVVSDSGGIQSCGSGYRVAPGWVLTAGHVVRSAVSIAVWLGAPRSLDPALGVGIDPAGVRFIEHLDLALLPVPEDSVPRGFVVPLFGVVDRQVPVKVPAVALGFPLLKLRPDLDPSNPHLRETRFASGKIANLEDARLGTLALRITDGQAPAERADHRSPWEGMSGAAVFTAPGGHLVGVVGKHQKDQDPAVLTVRPFMAEQGDGGHSVSVRPDWAGLLAQLNEPLPTVTAPATRVLAETLAQWAADEATPEALVGRDEDLADLAAFSLAEDQHWRWIRAEAFAGKTALLGWFALHPPPPGERQGSRMLPSRGQGPKHRVLRCRDLGRSIGRNASTGRLSAAGRYHQADRGPARTTAPRRGHDVPEAGPPPAAGHRRTR